MKSSLVNRFTAVLIFAFFCYLGLFAWNTRTGYLDRAAEHGGLGITTLILSPALMVKDTVKGWWTKYLALVDVAEENRQLLVQLHEAKRRIVVSKEELAELKRLRELLKVTPFSEKPVFAARVIAMRLGPQAILSTIAIDKGYTNGAVVGVPVLNHLGVVGKVYRSGPYASTVLLLNDPGFRLDVISQETRTPGIIKGLENNPALLEMNYVAQNAKIKEGELLVTAGLDGKFPKGIPVGIITSVSPGHSNLFLQVEVTPVVQFDNLEEVILLESSPTATKYFRETSNSSNKI